MTEIIYFELNNWMSEDDYPDAEPFETWCGNDEALYFDSQKWCKENKLVVSRGIIDQSVNWCVGATKEWVQNNCPELLTKYKEFLRPSMKSRFGQPFIEYSEENIGMKLCDINYKTDKWEFYTDEDIQEERMIKWLNDRDEEVYKDIFERRRHAGN